MNIARGQSNDLKKYTYGRHVVAHVEKVMFTKKNKKREDVDVDI